MVGWQILIEECNDLRNTATWCMYHRLRVNVNQQDRSKVQSHCRIGLLPQLLRQ